MIRRKSALPADDPRAVRILGVSLPFPDEATAVLAARARAFAALSVVPPRVLSTKDILDEYLDAIGVGR